MAKWQPLWFANAEVELQPLPPWLVDQRLAPFLVSEIKSVHKSHKWRTGLEREQLHSRDLASCSDRRLFLLGFVAEGEGVWTSAMDSAVFFQPKVRRGLRTTGFRSVG